MAEDDKKEFRKRFTELYERAEIALQKKNYQATANNQDIDPQAILHDLSVYQVELEMQNEQLKASQEFLEELSNKYRNLFNYSPVGYFSFSETGVILDVNLTGCNQLGFNKTHLVK